MHIYIHIYIHTYIHTCTSNRSWAKVESNKEVEYAKAFAAIESDHTNTNLRARHQQARQAHTLSQQGTHLLIHAYIHMYIHTCLHTYIHTYMYWISWPTFSQRIYIHSAMSAHIYMRISFNTIPNKYFHTHTYIYIHTYIHTYIHISIFIYV